MKNSPDRSGWMAALADLFGSSVELKGILKMPSNTVQYVKKCKASWRCHPLADSRTERSDEAPDSSLLIKNYFFTKRFVVAELPCLIFKR